MPNRRNLTAVGGAGVAFTERIPEDARWWQVANPNASAMKVFVQADGQTGAVHIEDIPATSTGVLHVGPGKGLLIGVTWPAAGAVNLFAWLFTSE